MYPATFGVPEKYTPSSKPAFYFPARAELELVALLEWSTGFGSLCDTASNTRYTCVRAFPCAWVQLSFSAMPSGFVVWTPPGDVFEIQELRWRNLNRSLCGAEKLEEKETKSQAAFGLLIHSVASLFYYDFLLYHCWVNIFSLEPRRDSQHLFGTAVPGTQGAGMLCLSNSLCGCGFGEEAASCDMSHHLFLRPDGLPCPPGGGPVERQACTEEKCSLNHSS